MIAFRVFQIEDNVDLATLVAQQIEDLCGAKVLVDTVNDLTSARGILIDEKPDILVLDLKDPSEALTGIPIWHEVWNHTFCPIVIHTALDETAIPGFEQSHPLVKYVQKCPGSDGQVATHVAGFLPHLEALAAVQNDARDEVRRTLRYVPQHLWSQPVESLPAGLGRYARRRIAALMDSAEDDEQCLNDCDQYLVPPIGPCL